MKTMEGGPGLLPIMDILFFFFFVIKYVGFRTVGPGNFVVDPGHDSDISVLRAPL